MVPIIVLLTLIAFIVIDLVLRVSLRKLEERKLQKKRREALDEGLRLEFADEAASLKRVEVDSPKARILAVDDEPVVLDSFRKILVLAGYSVDTVESGPEALTLLRRNDYDFVFTDLKMPGMDGLDVTKAAKHLRPDVDVVVITGYATVESAVSAMKYGAMDYVQKPFTEDELVEFADQLLIRRDERIARQKPPEIHLVTRSGKPRPSRRASSTCPAASTWLPQHTWVRVEMTGEGRVGLDDFFHKTVGGGRRRRAAGEGRPGASWRDPLSGQARRSRHRFPVAPVRPRVAGESRTGLQPGSLPSAALRGGLDLLRRAGRSQRRPEAAADRCRCGGLVPGGGGGVPARAERAG